MLKRREFVIASSAAVLTSCIPKLKPEKQPNIIVIVADDLRWNALGCMGNPIIQTPNIDALSKAGTTFENHFVTTSICADSRASIFTGLWKLVHKTDFLNPMPQALFQKSYPVVLREKGYFSGLLANSG